MIFVEGPSISLSEAKSQVRQFLAAQYPADVGDSPLVAPE